MQQLVTDDSDIERILALGRWAPSGDNTQPWRFEVLSDTHFVVHGRDTRRTCVYDIDGSASQLSLGMLLETLSVAAVSNGWAVSANLRPGEDPERPNLDVKLIREAGLPRDPLVDEIPRRSVQRRPLSTRSLQSAHVEALSAAIGDEHELLWLSAASSRLAVARLLYTSARLRLVTPEAYVVHRDVIQWNARFSADKIPDQALGVGRPLLMVMKFALASWERVRFFNRFLAGTVAPRLAMDFIPGLACGAHFLVVARRPPSSIEDYIATGRRVQRLWLTASACGLQVQPELTPLIFSKYADQDRKFSIIEHALPDARTVSNRLKSIWGIENTDRAIFMGRIGYGEVATSRSVRLPLAKLIQPNDGE